jgi:hypothetical protein
METITAFEFLSESFNLDFMTHAEVMLLCTAMDLYAKGKCREQRLICSRQVSGWPFEIKTESEMEEDILNAPEPELKNISEPTQ